jgi:hypothetical protein
MDFILWLFTAESRFKMNQIMGFNKFQLSLEECVSNIQTNLGFSILAVNGFRELLLFHTIQYQQQNIFALIQNSYDCWEMDHWQTATKLTQYLHLSFGF